MLDEEQRRQFIYSALHTHCNLLALRENMEQFQPRVRRFATAARRSLLGTINDLLFESSRISVITQHNLSVVVIKLGMQP